MSKKKLYCFALKGILRKRGQLKCMYIHRKMQLVLPWAHLAILAESSKA